MRYMGEIYYCIVGIAVGTSWQWPLKLWHSALCFAMDKDHNLIKQIKAVSLVETAFICF